MAVTEGLPETEALPETEGSPENVAVPVAGTRLAGRYRLDERIATAPEAAQWAATDERLARPATIWVLSPDATATAEVFAAARGAARLADPSLARIYDADDRCESPYIVSERAPGERLDHLIDNGLPEPALAAEMVADAATALAVAHAAGQRHLRLMPRSVWWDGTTVKLTGLSIEAALTAATAADPAAADTSALARILYALLTGYWPGSEPASLPRAPRRRGMLYSPRQVRAGVPGWLDAAVRRALMPVPDQSPIGAPGDLAQALRPAGAFQAPAARTLARVARAVGRGRQPVRPEPGRNLVTLAPAAMPGWTACQ